ncbi:MAG: hypothetical protein LC624_09475 [Halobacteriales archaeon]|nr:hypothetical protein [Halobacteriales archaeon]
MRAPGFSMRGFLLVGAVLLALAIHGAGYGNGTCPDNRHIVTLGTFPAAAYLEWFGDVPDPTAMSVYVESGALPGLQVGASELGASMRLHGSQGVLAVVAVAALLAGMGASFLQDARDAPAFLGGTRLGGHAGLAGLERPGIPSQVPGPAAQPLPVTGTMRFDARTVGVGSTYWDLYEPAITVAGTGTIYVSGHTAAADTLRSAALFSRDDGRTWAKLPDLQAATIPVVAEGVGQGDEGILAADAQGNAWLYDSDWIAGTSFLYQWCNDGAALCHVDPMSYDTAQSVLGSCGPRTIDKPWIMYGHGKLVMVNNGPGLGIDPDTQLQLGLYDTAAQTHTWNTCAGAGGRPGVPAIRDSDGLFAAVDATGPEASPFLGVFWGTDIAQPRVSRAFDTFGDWVACNAFNGYGAFAATGTYYVAGASAQGTLTIAASTDMESFATASFALPGQLFYGWMTGSPTGEGALLSFAVTPLDDCLHPTYYAAHVALVDGQVELSDVSVVAHPTNGAACGHYQGSSLGPDGRAYVVVFASAGGCLGPVPQATPGTHFPLKVYVQSGGPDV